MTVADQLKLIRRGAVELISDDELRKKLERSGRLRIKAGFDPTAPDLHLGHTVLLRKLRHFQDGGHKVVFLIGDATALVGDPSGQTQTRPVLTWDQVRENARTYLQQAQKILRADRQLFEVRYNSEWFLGRSPQNLTAGLEVFDFTKWVQLASKYTVARLLERDDFSKRLKAGKPLSMLELFYPLMQGYDSVKIAEQYGHCDVELGGTDQTFNLLVGRDLLKEFGHEPQVVLTMPLLEGLDGTHKMSKSLGNHVGIQDAPADMFGKLMSLPDTLIVKYLTLLTAVEQPRLDQLEKDLKAKRINPRDAKADMAAEIVSLYHGPEAASAARQEFANVFSKRQAPKNLKKVPVHVDAESRFNIVELLVSAKLVKSKNEARNLLRQNALDINGSLISSPLITMPAPTAVLRVGSSRFVELEVIKPR